MDIGLIYPAMELGGDMDALRRIGLLAEELGYEHLLAGDHVLGANRENRDPPLVGGPYDETTPFHDPFVVFSYLAAITQRLHFISSILILPQRQTVLVAKQAAELDLLSHERFTMGVGTGWNYVEYDSMGKDFASRGKRMNEQIALMRELWSKDLVDFRGEFESVDRAALIPRPRRNVPIYMGGFSDVAYKRAARIGDGFLFADIGQDVLATLDRMKQLLREAGRTEAGFGLHLAFHTISIEQTVEHAKRWRDAGGTRASVWTMDRGFTTAEEHMDFAKQTADALRKEGLMA